jgi:hypothetical protein
MHATIPASLSGNKQCTHVEAGSGHQPHDSHLSAHLREANWLCNTCILVLVRTRFYGSNYFSNRSNRDRVYSIGKYTICSILVVAEAAQLVCNYFSTNRIEIASANTSSVLRVVLLVVAEAAQLVWNGVPSRVQDGRCKRSFTLVLLGYHVLFSRMMDDSHLHVWAGV